MDNSTTVTIPKDLLDPFYRYKRHMIESSIISKNGGTTIIHNIDIITSEINRTADDIKKLFITTLSTSAIKKKLQNKKYQIHIRGKYQNFQLEEILENYILHEIICKTCGNPETIKSHEKYRCKACGNTQ